MVKKEVYDKNWRQYTQTNISDNGEHTKASELETPRSSLDLKLTKPEVISAQLLEEKADIEWQPLNESAN